MVVCVCVSSPALSRLTFVGRAVLSGARFVREAGARAGPLQEFDFLYTWLRWSDWHAPCEYAQSCVAFVCIGGGPRSCLTGLFFYLLGAFSVARSDIYRPITFRPSLSSLGFSLCFKNFYVLSFSTFESTLSKCTHFTFRPFEDPSSTARSIDPGVGR